MLKLTIQLPNPVGFVPPTITVMVFRNYRAKKALFLPLVRQVVQSVEQDTTLIKELVLASIVKLAISVKMERVNNVPKERPVQVPVPNVSLVTLGNIWQETDVTIVTKVLSP